MNLRTTTPLDIERTIILCFREHIVRRSTGELLSRRPDLSAAQGFSRGQRGALAALGAIAAVGLLLDWRLTIGLCVAVANGVFLAAVAFKLLTCLVGSVRGPRATYSQAVRDDRRLP